MSEFIHWTGELSVGIEEIDEQHKVLIKSKTSGKAGGLNLLTAQSGLIC